MSFFFCICCSIIYYLATRRRVETARVSSTQAERPGHQTNLRQRTYGEDYSILLIVEKFWSSDFDRGMWSFIGTITVLVCVKCVSWLLQGFGSQCERDAEEMIEKIFTACPQLKCISNNCQRMFLRNQFTGKILRKNVYDFKFPGCDVFDPDFTCSVLMSGWNRSCVVHSQSSILILLMFLPSALLKFSKLCSTISPFKFTHIFDLISVWIVYLWRTIIILCSFDQMNLIILHNYWAFFQDSCGMNDFEW